MKKPENLIDIELLGHPIKASLRTKEEESNYPESFTSTSVMLNQPRRGAGKLKVHGNVLTKDYLSCN